MHDVFEADANQGAQNISQEDLLRYLSERRFWD